MLYPKIKRKCDLGWNVMKFKKDKIVKVVFYGVKN